jgi:transcriptional regulator with XRE-family HTH domain
MELELRNIKSRMRRHRTMSGVPISELARIAGVSEATIRRYDDPSDPREPSLYVVAKLCAHYGISLDWLVFGSSANMREDKRFRMMLDNLSHNLPLEAQLGFTDFVQGAFDLALQMGRNGASLAELQLEDKVNGIE